MTSTTKSVLPVAVYDDLSDAAGDAVQCLRGAVRELREKDFLLPFGLADLLTVAGQAGERLAGPVAAGERECGEEVWDETAEGGAA